MYCESMETVDSIEVNGRSNAKQIKEKEQERKKTKERNQGKEGQNVV